MEIDSDERTYEIVNTEACHRYLKLISDKINAIYNKKVYFPIYHYTGASALCSILTNKELWFTKWHSLNDPTEFCIMHNIIKEAIKLYEMEDENFYNMLSLCNNFDIYNKDAKVVKWYTEYNAFVLYLTKRKDALHMWSRYTNVLGQDGYAIAFDNISDISGEDCEMYWLPVIYEKKEQEAIVKKFIHELYMAYNDSELMKYGKYDRDAIVMNLYGEVIKQFCGAFKHEAYQDEDEVRVVLYTHKKELIKHRISNGIVVPYVPIKIDTEKVESVRLSPALNAKIAVPGIRSLKSDLGLRFNIELSAVPFRSI